MVVQQPHTGTARTTHVHPDFEVINSRFAIERNKLEIFFISWEEAERFEQFSWTNLDHGRRSLNDIYHDLLYVGEEKFEIRFSAHRNCTVFIQKGQAVGSRLSRVTTRKKFPKEFSVQIDFHSHTRSHFLWIQFRAMQCEAVEKIASDVNTVTILVEFYLFATTTTLCTTTPSILRIVELLCVNFAPSQSWLVRFLCVTLLLHIHSSEWWIALTLRNQVAMRHQWHFNVCTKFIPFHPSSSMNIQINCVHRCWWMKDLLSLETFTAFHSNIYIYNKLSIALYLMLHEAVEPYTDATVATVNAGYSITNLFVYSVFDALCLLIIYLCLHFLWHPEREIGMTLAEKATTFYLHFQ